MVKNTEKNEVDHLEWLVRCRSQNQQTSLVLYKLMTENSARLVKDQILSNAGITLIAISFNLWRAVFLADEESGIVARFDHSVAFLKTLISDNAIAYTQDKNARAWACISYLNNARFRLSSLNENPPNILPNFIAFPPNIKNYMQLWEHLQTNADLAIGNYANAVKKLRP